MTPIPPTPPTAEHARRAAFRRGQVLTVIVAVVTAAAYLVPGAVDLLSGHPAHRLPEFIAGPVMGGLLCWCALRGGGFSTGCLTIGYSLFLLAGAMCAGVVVAAGCAPTLFPDASAAVSAKLDFHDLPGTIISLLPLAAVLAWAAFAFWVLVLSADARFYRVWCRRGVRSGDDPSFADWHLRQPSGQ